MMQQSQCIHHEETYPRPRLTVARLVEGRSCCLLKLPNRQVTFQVFS
jgi:hypothetical protein